MKKLVVGVEARSEEQMKMFNNNERLKINDNSEKTRRTLRLAYV